MAEMITFTIDRFKFNYRIVGVAVHHAHVLLQRSKADTHWALPGGRAEFFEDSTATLRREMDEELHVAAVVDRLIWIVENFYTNQGKSVHELALYYEMHFPKQAALYEFTKPFIGNENGEHLIFQWHPLDRLHTISVLPTFLQQGLHAIPTTTEHIIISQFQEKN
jgi:8-oxo-dGTP pyrophosphatase MutT (NUDIX family)